MTDHGFYRRFFVISVVCMLLIGLQPAAPAHAQTGAQSYTPAPLILRADPAISNLHILPPSTLLQPHQASASTILVDFVPDGQINDDGTTCSAFPANAQTALNYAASIWAGVLVSSIPIHIQACWAPMNLGVLGQTRAQGLYANFSGAPKPNTYYEVALVNAFTHSDFNGASAEVIATFSSGMNFYFGTDGNPGLAQYDLASVALHEFAHGLGFAGSMSVVGANGQWGYGGQPAIYDRFTTDGSGNLLINYPNSSPELKNALQGGVGGVYFTGTNAQAANAGVRVKLYSPSAWADGSSYSHLDTTYDGTANALMTYSLGTHEVVHDLGPVVSAMMKDFGWAVVLVVLPAAPSGLVASPTSASEIDLTWADNSTNESGFKVERSPDGTTWVQIATPTAGSTTYPDTSLHGGTRYFYRVRANNTAGNSAYSNTANAITQGPPPAPTNLKALSSGIDRVYLTWTIQDNIGCTFVVEQSPDGSTGWVARAPTAAGANNVTITGLTKNTPYFYRVKATFATHPDSAYAPTASATTWLKSFPLYLPVVSK